MATNQINPAIINIPEEELSIDEIRAVATQAGITLNEWYARCIVEYTRQAAAYYNSQETQDYFDIAKELGPINLTPKPRA